MFAVTTTQTSSPFVICGFASLSVLRGFLVQLVEVAQRQQSKILSVFKQSEAFSSSDSSFNHPQLQLPNSQQNSMSTQNLVNFTNKSAELWFSFFLFAVVISTAAWKNSWTWFCLIAFLSFPLFLSLFVISSSFWTFTFWDLEAVACLSSPPSLLSSS